LPVASTWRIERNAEVALLLLYLMSFGRMLRPASPQMLETALLFLRFSPRINKKIPCKEVDPPFYRCLPDFDCIDQYNMLVYVKITICLISITQIQ
jgi:hypothetical protein